MDATKILFCALLVATTAPAAMAGEPSPLAATAIANEGTLGQRWQLAGDGQLATADYPAALAGRADDVCVALGYRIGLDGRTSGFAVLRQWNSASGAQEPVSGYWQSFAGSAADAVSQWRFAPRADTGAARETYTVATIAFTATGVPADAIRQHCEVSDLTALLQFQGSNYLRDRSREARDIERTQRRAERARIARVAAKAVANRDRFPNQGAAPR